ncbi:MAG: PASTA domain-containing protein [Eggerthellaceae bacterium]
MICKACGHDNSDDSQYCSQCGLPLSVEEAFDDNAQRPVLSGVVPYVIEGQKTGAIPGRCEGESDAAEGDEAGVAVAESCDAPDAPIGEGALDSAEADTPDPSEEGGAQGDAKEGDAAADDPVLNGVPRNDRPQGPAGLASWDREFPTVQMTAVMPPVEDGSAVQDAPSEAGSASSAQADDEAASEEAADAPEGVCVSEEGSSEESEKPGDADESGDPDDADDYDDDEIILKSKHSAKRPSHASSVLGDEDGSDATQGSGPVFGKHSNGVDRDAVTQRIRKVPGSDPDTTAVISSVSSKGSKSFSDAARDRADFVKRIPAKWFKIAAAVLAVIVLAVAVKLLFFNTPIPQVVDSTSREARTRLSDAGFEVEVKSEAVDGAEDGTVLACEPECGTRHRKGSTVTITVASSQTIPDVVGMDLESARQMLEEQGATNIKESLKKSNQPENTVIAVSPDVDQAFDLDDEIVLTVATTAYLPDVVGKTQDEAVKTLEDAGYAVSVKWADSEEESGKVVSTKPKAKELANLGSTVTLMVASPGPSDFMHIMEYFDIKPQDLSEYLKWKGFVVAGSYAYTNDWNGEDCVSQKWSRTDGATVSFTPAPYIEDNVLDVADYMAQGRGFEGVRIFIPAKSDASLGVDFTTAKVKEYMEACGLEGMSDSCTQSDLDYNGKSGKDLGTGDFICAQGTQDGKVWTILITSESTYIGAGGYECYEDMEPICDWVAVNEIFQAR